MLGCDHAESILPTTPITVQQVHKPHRYPPKNRGKNYFLSFMEFSIFLRYEW